MMKGERMRRGSAGQPSCPSFRRPWILLGVTVLFVALFLGVREPEPAAAHNDYCAQQSAGGWYCIWFDSSLAPATPHWFQAAVTLRNWNYAAVSDGHGGTVEQKCVHIKRGSDGYTVAVACGTGVKDGFTSSTMRPGYLFTRHGAGGARNITGDGAHG
jgi:hypothetical protein